MNGTLIPVYNPSSEGVGTYQWYGWYTIQTRNAEWTSVSHVQYPRSLNWDYSLLKKNFFLKFKLLFLFSSENYNTNVKIKNIKKCFIQQTQNKNI